MADFDPSFMRVIELEGGWTLTDNDGDLGGMTFAGISRKANPNWSGWPLIDDGAISETPVLRDKVKTLYKIRYWDPLRLDEIKDQGVASHIFSCSVLSGPSTAALLSQVGANVIADGDIGPITVSAINSISSELWEMRFCVARIIRYSKIVTKDPTQRKWFLGWVNRALGDVG